MIYIVEDDASIRELEQYALQSNGYEVQGFASAEPFWQAMRTAEPELKDRGADLFLFADLFIKHANKELNRNSQSSLN